MSWVTYSNGNQYVINANYHFNNVADFCCRAEEREREGLEMRDVLYLYCVSLVLMKYIAWFVVLLRGGILREGAAYGGLACVHVGFDDFLRCMSTTLSDGQYCTITLGYLCDIYLYNII